MVCYINKSHVTLDSIFSNNHMVLSPGKDVSSVQSSSSSANSEMSGENMNNNSSHKIVMVKSVKCVILDGTNYLDWKVQFFEDTSC